MQGGTWGLMAGSIFPDLEFIDTDDYKLSHLVVINKFILLVSIKVSNNTATVWSLPWDVCYFVDRVCAAHFCTLQPGEGPASCRHRANICGAELFLLLCILGSSLNLAEPQFFYL